VTVRLLRHAGCQLGRSGWRGLLILAAALAALAGALPARPAVAQAPLARFEPAPCPYEAGRVPPGERVDCGYLVVPEDRAADSPRTLRLAVAILRSPSPSPAPDPIVYLSGGPGDAALDTLEYWLDEAGPLRTARDIILFDQRGTGYSQPSLACPEFEALAPVVLGDVLSVNEWLSLEVEGAQACRDRLLAEGVNLAAYDTAASAADLKDLRVSLGLLEWNLFAHSYGTRLALTLMRDYPAGLRSAVLNAAQPLQAGWFEEAAANTDRAFNQLFSGCAQDPACARAFPDLPRRFFDAVDRLNTSPLILTLPGAGQQLVSGRDLIGGGFSALYESDLIPYLPLAVAQIHAGNRAVVEGFATALGNENVIGRSGVWYSVMCRDEAPFNDRDRLAASLAAYPRYADVVRLDATLPVCDVWGAGQRPALETEPVRSAVPALVLAGQYDPIHPPAWSQLVASTLTNSFYYELANTGHDGVFFGCGQDLAAAFIQQPGVAPNLPCAQSRAGPPFVTSVALNPGVYRLASRLLLAGDWRAALPFAVCALLFISALLVWPIAALRGLRRHAERGPWMARWLAALVAALHLGFSALLLVLIVTTAEAQPYLLLFGLPPEAALLFAVPWVAAALSLGLVVFAVLAWKDGYWSAFGRIHYTLVTVAALGFVWLLRQWGLI